MEYHVGDIVEIVSVSEYRKRGGSCTAYCAIAEYAGSICEVTKAIIHGVNLSPIKMQRNFPHEYNKEIEHYSWSPAAIKKYEGEVDSALSEAFDTVFG